MTVHEMERRTELQSMEIERIDPKPQPVSLQAPRASEDAQKKGQPKVQWWQFFGVAHA